MSNTVTALLGAALLLVGMPGTARAATADEMVASRAVTTHDLDLFTNAGRRLLDQRIANAARQVCRAERISLIAGIDRNCLAAALASGLRQRDRLFAARGLVGDYRSAQVSR